MDFESLVGQINQVQDVLQAQAAHAINLTLTARNWLVGEKLRLLTAKTHEEEWKTPADKLFYRLSANHL